MGSWTSQVHSKVRDGDSYSKDIAQQHKTTRFGLVSTCVKPCFHLFFEASKAILNLWPSSMLNEVVPSVPDSPLPKDSGPKTSRMLEFSSHLAALLQVTKGFELHNIPSGKRTKNYGKPPFSIGKIHYFDWAIFNSYVSLPVPEGSPFFFICLSDTRKFW